MSATKPPSYDDRFVVPLEPSRRGAHRARMSPFVASLPIIAVVVVVVAVIALAWTLFGGNLFGKGNPTAGVSTGTGPISASSSAPAPSASHSTNPSASTNPSGSASTSTTPSVSASVDKTATITVLNPTGITGLAKKAATSLQNQGWTNARASYATTTLRPTTIFYATSSQKATAEAVQAALGVGEVRRSTSMAGTGIAVVLGKDYTG